MKPNRFPRWGCTLFAPGIRTDRCMCLVFRTAGHSIRSQSALAQLKPVSSSSSSSPSSSSPSSSSSSAAAAGDGSKFKKQKRERNKIPPSPTPITPLPNPQPDQDLKVLKAKEHRTDVSETTFRLEKLPSPPINTPSPKLSALHARLALSSRIPIQTLARCLVDETADPDYRFNNSLLARLGRNLLAYHLSEHFICHYPRLPMVVLIAAIDAYIGSAALRHVTQEWGVEVAAEPGGEIDPGLLQFRREFPSKRVKQEVLESLERFAKSRVAETMIRNTNYKIIQAKKGGDQLTSTVEQASRDFARAVFGAIYLHCGAAATQEFISAHILSRHLDLGKLFTFKQPTKDLARLCNREGFEPPVARLISETGRLSRHPVFVVGIFSGRDKIGEDAGASLDEARFKAATKALKGWYLYSPKSASGEVMVPSMMFGDNSSGKTWQPAHIDDGEVIV